MLVSLDGVARFFGDKCILQNVSVTIEDADRIGLVGANGIGKSTLLHVLCGQLEPDEGTVSHSADLTIGILEQNGGLSQDNDIYHEMRSVFADLLAAEERLRAMEAKMAANGGTDMELSEEYSRLSSWFELKGGYDIDVKIKTVLNGMGFEDRTWSQNILSLSGGEKTRLALAKLLLTGPQLLVLDEPTNHLDFKTLMWLEDYLQDYQGGLLVVSHDRYFLDKMVGKIWEIENRTVISYKEKRRKGRNQPGVHCGGLGSGRDHLVSEPGFHPQRRRRAGMGKSAHWGFLSLLCQSVYQIRPACPGAKVPGHSGRRGRHRLFGSPVGRGRGSAPAAERADQDGRGAESRESVCLFFVASGRN